MDPDRHSYRPLYGAGTNAPGVYGLFDPTTLLVRFSRDIAEILKPDEHGASIHLTSAGDARLEPYAATFHETVHWWQSIAYSTGFLLAMAPPTQALAVVSDLRRVMPATRIAKPFVRWAESTQNRLGEPLQHWVNNALNNWLDVEYGSGIIMSPTMATKFMSSPLFESVGHSLSLLLRQVKSVLSVSLEDGVNVHEEEMLRNAVEFDRLSQAQFPGFFFGESPLSIPLLGFQDIAETQARMTELQLLSMARGGGVSLGEFAHQGMLGPRYSLAMDQFFVAAGLERPADPLSPEVLLLQLSCEMALNSHIGYATPISCHERLISDLHPGWRLMAIASVVKSRSAELRRLVRPADKDAHLSVSTLICRELGWPTPDDTMGEVLSYCSSRKHGSSSVTNAEQGRFSAVNGQIRYLYGLHVSAVRDRRQFPEFFCWPALNTSFAEPRRQEGRAKAIAKLLEMHSPPFVHGTLRPETGEGGSVTYSGMSGLPKDVGDKLVTNYFYAHIAYDLVRQLICGDGAFTFDFRWLDPGKSLEFYKNVGERAFGQVMGVPISEVSLL